MNYKKLKDLIKKELKEQNKFGVKVPSRGPKPVIRYRLDAGGCLQCPSSATPAQCPFTDSSCSSDMMGEEVQTESKLKSLKRKIREELANLVNEKSPCQTGCLCLNGGGCSDACCGEEMQPPQRGVADRKNRRGTAGPIKGCDCGNGTFKPECCDRMVNRPNSPLEEMMSNMENAGTREWEEALTSSSPWKLCCLLKAACCAPR